MDGAKTVVLRGESSTARSAIALERKKRVRWKVVAFIALKKTNRFAPALSADRSRRRVARPFSSSIVPRGWSRIVAARWTTVSTPRRAWRIE